VEKRKRGGEEEEEEEEEEREELGVKVVKIIRGDCYGLRWRQRCLSRSEKNTEQETHFLK
jgi:hypothetical protein